MMVPAPRTILTVVLLLAAMWLGSRGPVYVSADRPGVDSGVFTAVAWHMLQGEVLYRDVWDHKPPVVHVLNVAALWAGERWAGEASINAVRQMERLFGAVAAGLAFLLAWLALRRVWPEGFAAVAVAAVASVLMTMMLFHPLIFEGGNVTEEYAVTFMLAGMAAAVASRQIASRRGSAVLVGLCGFAMGCAVLTKEPFLLTALPWATLAVWPRRSTGGTTASRSTGVPPVSRMGVSPMQTQPAGETFPLRHDQHGLEARATHGRDAHATARASRSRHVVLPLLLGALIPLAACVAYFLVNGGLAGWWDMIAYNVAYTSADPERKAFHLRLAANFLQMLVNFSLISWLAFAAAVAGVVGAFGREFRRRTGGLIVVVLADWIMALLATSLSGRQYGHYHLQLVPSMSLLAVFGVAFVVHRMMKVSRCRSEVAGGLIVLVAALIGFGENVPLIGPRGIITTDVRARKFLAQVGIRTEPDVIARHANHQFGGFVHRLAKPMSRWEGDTLTTYIADMREAADRHKVAGGGIVWAPSPFLSYVYAQAGVRSPTPHLYVHQWTLIDTPASTAKQKVERIFHDLQTNPPLLIVLHRADRKMLEAQDLDDVLRTRYSHICNQWIDIDWLEDPAVEIWGRDDDYAPSSASAPEEPRKRTFD